MMEFTFNVPRNNRRDIATGLVLLASLLMMRIIVVISQLLFSGYPSFRVMMGLDLLFVILIPFFIIFISAESMELKKSFVLPAIVVGILFPICDALFLSPTLLLSPAFYIPFLIGGLGFGFIGLAGNHYHRNFSRSMVFFTIGIGVILLNSATFIPITWYVITGDAAALLFIQGL
jgi:hypothetical protein